ncbi:ABC transporter permease [Arundinibacter roseus]|uniref:FtsX-like permease family protein n=1 Tax=Arundinibacter roseus TaxID=2070510 RepID=A0A4R4K9H0_9BACT|nr:ABC transporter permease [Arundinibacter roseus]TDB64163.1 FtsX-like permease family protein [Arundinibacter roseus]
MIQNYLKIAFRNLLRNKVYTFIHVLGLGLGISAFVFILEYVSLEKSVNQFHTNVDRMYRLVNVATDGASWGEVEPGWAALAKERFPEIEDYCRFADGIASGVMQKAEGGESFKEESIGYVEGNFFEFFTFPLLKGSAEALKQPNVIFLSESTAAKYFGKTEAPGKTLLLHNQFGKTTFTVGGIYKDMTDLSDIRYDMVLSLETLKSPANTNGNDWVRLDNLDNQYINAFFLVREQANYQELEAKFNTLRNELSQENDGIVFRLQAATNIHLAPSLNDPLLTTGNVKYVYMLAGIALLILLIAWFNYINLSTANALKRANEVGVRKVIGATQAHLIGQFLGESLLTNGLGFCFALMLVGTLQPLFAELIGKQVSLQILGNTPFWMYGLGLLLAGSVLSGLYSAWILSRFKVIETLKGKRTSNSRGIWLRKGLVVGQFVISTSLILATIVIYSQLRHLQTGELGINTEQLLVVSGPQIGKDSTFATRSNAFVQTLAEQSFVQEYATSNVVPSRYYNFRTSGFTQPGSKPKDELKSYAFAVIGDRYLKTYGISIKAGRNFTPQETDVEWNNNSKVMLNERAVAELGFSSPEEAIQTKIKWDERYLEVIGVVADYHHTSLKNSIDPIIFYPQKSAVYYSIRLTPEGMGDKVAKLEKLYKTSFPGNPFDFFFMDENYQKAYYEEQQYGKLFTTASLLAVFIACLGLFGLATYTVESRTKEIGVRKVLGASVSSVVMLLSKDFLALVGVAILIASPVAAYFLNQWLQDFPYRIAMEWWIFVAAAGLALLIAFVTVGFQSVKAGLMNPVDSLRSE